MPVRLVVPAARGCDTEKEFHVLEAWENVTWMRRPPSTTQDATVGLERDTSAVLTATGGAAAAAAGLRCRPMRRGARTRRTT
jgi:hypothetical protein